VAFVVGYRPNEYFDMLKTSHASFVISSKLFALVLSGNLKVSANQKHSDKIGIAVYVFYKNGDDNFLLGLMELYLMFLFGRCITYI